MSAFRSTRRSRDIGTRSCYQCTCRSCALRCYGQLVKFHEKFTFYRVSSSPVLACILRTKEKAQRTWMSTADAFVSSLQGGMLMGSPINAAGTVPSTAGGRLSSMVHSGQHSADRARDTSNEHSASKMVLGVEHEATEVGSETYASIFASLFHAKSVVAEQIVFSVMISKRPTGC